MFQLKLNKTMKNFQWSLISLITASFIHLMLRIMLGKEIGPSGLGIYTLIFTIYMLGMQFAGFGIGSALTKYIAEYHDNLSEIKEFISVGILGSIVSGSVMGVFLYLLSNIISTLFFHNPSMINLLKFTALCFPFIAVQKAVIGSLNGLMDMKRYAIMNITQSISVLIFTVFLVHSLDMNVRGAVLGFVIPTILVGLVSPIFIRNYLKAIPKFANKILKEFSLFGFYVVLTNSIGIISTEIDSLMIGYFMNATDVGYYAVAIIFIQGLTLIPDAIQRVTTPLIATFYGKRDVESIRSLIKETVTKVVFIILFIDLIMIIFGKTLIRIIFTDEFIPAYPPLLILLIGYSIYAAYVSIGTCLASIGKVQIIFKISVVCAGLNTILNVILISKFGLIGAACATSASLVFTTLTNIYFVNKYTSKKYLGIPDSNIKSYHTPLVK